LGVNFIKLPQRFVVVGGEEPTGETVTVRMQTTYGVHFDCEWLENKPPQVTRKYKADVELSNGWHHVVLEVRHNAIP
jgi:hypothetical protein